MAPQLSPEELAARRASLQKELADLEHQAVETGPDQALPGPSIAFEAGADVSGYRSAAGPDVVELRNALGDRESFVAPATFDEAVGDEPPKVTTPERRGYLAVDGNGRVVFVATWIAEEVKT